MHILHTALIDKLSHSIPQAEPTSFFKTVTAEDYYITSPFTFMSSPSQECVDINLLNDTSIEGDHRFSVSLDELPMMSTAGRTDILIIDSTEGRFIKLSCMHASRDSRQEHIPIIVCMAKRIFTQFLQLPKMIVSVRLRLAVIIFQASMVFACSLQ